MTDSMESLRELLKGKVVAINDDYVEVKVKISRRSFDKPAAKPETAQEEGAPQTKITDLLKQWGRWSRSGIGIGNLYSEANDNDFWITDDIGLWIESGVAQLGMHHPRQQRAIMLFYRERHNIPMVAHDLKIGETKARMLLSNAECWIEGNLESNGLVA